MMSVSQELNIATDLMMLPVTNFRREDELIIVEILERLATSHTQTIFEVNDDNIRQYVAFSQWIRSLKEIFESRSKSLESIAVTMGTIFMNPTR